MPIALIVDDPPALVAPAPVVESFAAVASQKPSASFWEAASGYWVGEASYADERFSPLIQDYNTVMRVEVVDGEVVIDDFRFYPPEPTNSNIEPGRVAVSRTRGNIEGDRTDFGRTRGIWQATGPVDAVGTLSGGPEGAPRYRFWVTLTRPDIMIWTTLGFGADAEKTPPGALSGISVVRLRRIDAAEFDAQRLRFEQQYRTGPSPLIEEAP